VVVDQVNKFLYNCAFSTAMWPVKYNVWDFVYAVKVSQFFFYFIVY